MCRAYAGVTLWWLGVSGPGPAESHQAPILAGSWRPRQPGIRRFFAAWLHQPHLQLPRPQERAEAAIALAERVLLCALGTRRGRPCGGGR